jgi:hypothetical protein
MTKDSKSHKCEENTAAPALLSDTINFFFLHFTFYSTWRKTGSRFVCFRYCSSRYGDSRVTQIGLIFHDLFIGSYQTRGTRCTEVVYSTYQSALGCVGDLEPAISTVKQLILLFTSEKIKSFTSHSGLFASFFQTRPIIGVLCDKSAVNLALCFDFEPGISR